MPSTQDTNLTVKARRDVADDNEHEAFQSLERRHARKARVKGSKAVLSSVSDKEIRKFSTISTGVIV